MCTSTGGAIKFTLHKDLASLGPRIRFSNKIFGFCAEAILGGVPT